MALGRGRTETSIYRILAFRQMALRMFLVKVNSLNVLPNRTSKSDSISLIGERYDKSQEITSFSNKQKSFVEWSFAPLASSHHWLQEWTLSLSFMFSGLALMHPSKTFFISYLTAKQTAVDRHFRLKKENIDMFSDKGFQAVQIRQICDKWPQVYVFLCSLQTMREILDKCRSIGPLLGLWAAVFYVVLVLAEIQLCCENRCLSHNDTKCN